MLTKGFSLPSEEELTVQEIELSSPVLRASANHLGKYCEEKNNEFMLCKVELDDPRKCIREGKDVTSCSLEFFRLLKGSCLQEFNQHANCIDKSSGDFAFRPCRKTQSVYDQCVLEKMNIERPHWGYFTRPRVHQSERPPPPKEKKAVYPDASYSLPEDAPKPPAKYGARLYFTTE